MTIEWCDSYEVGHDAMDTEHEDLFARINEFLGASDMARMAQCALSLQQHAHAHFAHEESVMRGCNYPRLDLHVREHSELLAEFDGVSEAIANGSLNAAELETFLFDWLLNHIGTWDADLASYAGSCNTSSQLKSSMALAPTFFVS